MAERKVRDIDEKAIALHWQSRIEGGNHHFAPRFRYADMVGVVDDIVRIREDQGGYSLEETDIPIELSGAEGPITLYPRFGSDRFGGYLVEMGLHDDDDRELASETWDIVDGFKEHRKRRTAIFHGSRLATCGTTRDPMDMERKRMTPNQIEDWVSYVWQAHLDTSPDF